MLIVGDPPAEELESKIGKLERALRREINYTVMTLQTETSDVGTVVSDRQILELPLAVNSTGQSFLRSPETFVFLTPGTAGPGTADSSSGIFQSKLAGGQNFGNEVLLDGASSARADSGSAFDQTAPSVEALDEFKVITSTIPAQFGRTTGGVESFTTKSGANRFHGTAYDLFRNEALDAKSWFSDLTSPLRHSRGMDNDNPGKEGGPTIRELYPRLDERQLKKPRKTSKGTWS